MPIFDNHDGLMSAISNDIRECIQEVSLEVLEILKYNIRQIVYLPYAGLVREYQRREENGGFLGSWTTKSDISPDKIEVIIFSDPNLMSPPDPFSLDGSDDLFLDLSPMDRRDIMDRAIAEGTDYDFFVPKEKSPYGDPPDNWWTRPRDYMTPTITWIDKNKIIDLYMKKALKNRGIKFEFKLSK